MSGAYYIVAKDEIEGFDPFVSGTALGHAGEEALLKICNELNVTPLLDFVSQDPDEDADFLAGEGDDDDVDTLPGEHWYTADQGLATVRALKRHLTENPKAIKDAQAICDDLAEYEVVLERLKKENVLWHLAAEY